MGLVPLFVDFRDGLFLRFTQSWMILPGIALDVHIGVVLS